MKCCNKCGVLKPLDEFVMEKRVKSGRAAVCKTCAKARTKEWRDKNPEKQALAAYRWRKQPVIADILRKRHREWLHKNSEKVKEYSKKYYAKNQDNCKLKSKIWLMNNRERKNEYNKKWLEKNPETARMMRKRDHARKRSTAKGILCDRMRLSIYDCLHRSKNGKSWKLLVGYTEDQLKNHIEKLFKPGMNWEEFMSGKIHIDHIIPISAFNFNSPDDIDFKKCWSLKNLQPMWAIDNLRKNNKLIKPFQPSLTI